MLYSKDVYVTLNLRQTLRVTILNRTYHQVHFSYRCYRKKEPLIRWCGFIAEGKCDLEGFPICMKAFPSFVQGRLRRFVLPQEMLSPTPKSSYLRVTVTGSAHPWLECTRYVYARLLLLVQCCCSNKYRLCSCRDLMLRTTNGASVCACVRAILNTNLSSWTIPSHTSSGFQKHPVQHIKQRYNIIIEPHIGSYTWERLCSPFATCDTPRISSLPHPEGEPCNLCTRYTAG